LVPDAAAESAALLAASGNRTSDGPTVKLGAKTAIATGGDTLLGRILTRSVLAADARQAAPAPPAAVAPDDASSASQAGTGGHPNAAAADSAVSAFVKQFEAALKAGTSADAAQTISNPLQSGAPGVPPAPHAALEATPSIGPAVAPFAIVRAEAPAAPTPAAVAPPIDHSAIADQVLRGAFMRNVGQSSEMRLTLTPHSLGDVTVKLVVNAGSVTAHVVAETADVRDALVAAQPQLTKSLADAGLKLTGFSVDLSGGGFAGFSQQNDQSRNGDRSRRPADVADGDESIPDSRLEAIPSFAPSAVSRSRVGDYNYLA
jgi:hypothetical protein